MNDLKIAAVFAAIALPFLIWANVGVLWRGQIFLTDDGGKVTSHFKRREQPVQYWALTVFNVALTAGAIALVVWQFVILPH